MWNSYTVHMVWKEGHIQGYQHYRLKEAQFEDYTCLFIFFCMIPLACPSHLENKSSLYLLKIRHPSVSSLQRL